jgi:cytochrome P450
MSIVQRSRGAKIPFVGAPARKLLKPYVINGLLPNARVQSGAAYAPLDAGFQQDPYPAYRRLRANDPVHWSELSRGWVLSRYEHVDAVLRDHKRFASDERRAGDQAPPYQTQFPEGRSILALDPPDHTRLRGLIARAFTPRAIAELEPRIKEIVDEILTAFPEGERVDVMNRLAVPLPVTVIAEMLGVPAKDQRTFKDWSDDVSRILEPTITPQEIEAAQRSAAALSDYFCEVITERRREPRGDLISRLIAAEEDGETLSVDEMLVMLRLLLVAGNETTTNLIGNGLLALLRHPDQLARLRDDPSLLEPAIEELLRFDSAVQTDGRTALEDMELEGKPARRGQRIALLIGSANRDARVYERANELDITRDEAPHVSRAWHPPLHRSASGADGGADCDRGADGAVPRDPADGSEAALQGPRRPARAQAPAGHRRAIVRPRGWRHGR